MVGDTQYGEKLAYFIIKEDHKSESPQLSIL